MKTILVILILGISIYQCIGQSVELPSSYNVLGPFAIGQREYGLDTLEAYGGIFNIRIGDNSTYPSELGTGGRVGWTQVQTSAPGQFSITFDDQIDWSFYQQVFGWTIWLYYGYAIGQFEITSPNSYIIDCTGIRTYYIKSMQSGQIFELQGDFYGYGVGQQVIELPVGQYQIFYRIQSSVRLNQSPVASFQCTMETAWDQLMVLPSETIMSDIVGGLLASPYASVTIINVSEYPLENITVELQPNSIFNQQPLVRILDGLSGQNIAILSGQKLSIPIWLEIKDNPPSYDCPMPIPLNILSRGVVLATANLTLNCTEWGNPYLFTFLDFDSTVQYAMLTPPATSCGQTPELCNIMLALHGAGVEASYMGWVNAIPKQDNMWIIFPTGRRSWGYDWEGASRRNAFTALQYLSTQMPGVPISMKNALSIDSQKILVVGHSMGSHGCWSTLSHFGDLALGGVCAAGFSKLQGYVFYNTRPGFAYIDPSLQGILMSAIAENDVDIHSTNLVGLPLLARYGQNDTNVNPWHTRRIARMVCEQSENSTAVIVNEVPNEGHWFNGMLNDQYMQNFYNYIQSQNQFVPPIPETIVISTYNPGVSGSRANLLILQTLIPGRIARIRLTKISPLVWNLQTQNVARFGVVSQPVRQEGLPEQLIIDGQKFMVEFYPEVHYYRQDKYAVNSWNQTDDQQWPLYEKSPLTYGPIRQIFEKQFIIIYGTNCSEETQSTFRWAATFISNFYNTNGRGSVIIIADTEFVPPPECSPNSNYILLGNTYENLISSKYSSQMIVTFNDDGSFYLGYAFYQGYNIGTAFIAPNECGQGLLLVVAGTDEMGFMNALHTLPQISGITLPDFVVVGNEYGWKGVGGILSTGFWNYDWTVQPQCTYFSLQPYSPNSHNHF
ncbi:hypothetical protein DLAC_02333 [Tieghemostelium lacteum]|uniref:Uncharacterized protein n=1 Tax=Tieghemostelium lacteum TaxID=361077 RepID=A0A152A575_TIELA|nr:hypothetical protein DLAC_02333 [Tieghemostelium lacteum]|eukprot:KYR01215.1 hypothetical protein DLAC_02333 [Tieghemostelium lacteum]